MPKFSIVIPLYNKASHIERAIQSVLTQTFQDFEIIVINDGSTDSSVEVVKSISDSRIRLVKQKNAGASVARNRGIKESKSDLIAFLDADDAWKTKFLETILRLIKNYSEAGAYASAYELHEPNGKIILPKYKGIPPFPWEGLIPNYFRSALCQPPICTSAIAIPKHIFTDVGEFPVGEPLGEDLDMWGRIALKYPIAFSWQVGATYFLDADNRACINYVTPDRPFIRTAEQVIKNGGISESLVQDLRKYINKLRIYVFSSYISAGKPNIARRLLCIYQKDFGFRFEWFFWYFKAILPVPVMSFIRYIKGRNNKVQKYSHHEMTRNFAQLLKKIVKK